MNRLWLRFLDSKLQTSSVKNKACDKAMTLRTFKEESPQKGIEPEVCKEDLKILERYFIQTDYLPGAIIRNLLFRKRLNMK